MCLHQFCTNHTDQFKERFTSTSLRFAGFYSISNVGVITLVKALDYETTQSYPLLVTITDNGSTTKSTTVSVQIAVNAANEHAPVFTNSGSYTTSISEDATLGSEIVRVTANDADQDAQVTYSLLSGSDGKFFIDDSNGRIYLLKAVDRETKASYSMLVQASDGTNVVNSSVDVTVSDVNDNSPVCSPTSYAASAREDVAIATSVVRVTCSDEDDGINGQLVFR